MRTYILVLTLCFSLTMASQEVQITWNKDLTVAKELAKSQNKPILVYFTKADCTPCQQFYGNVFKQKDFMDISNDFVLLMMDGTSSDVNSTDLEIIKRRRYIGHYNRTNTYPALLVLNSDGIEVSDPLLTTDQVAIDAYVSQLKTLK